MVFPAFISNPALMSHKSSESLENSCQKTGGKGCGEGGRPPLRACPLISEEGRRRKGSTGSFRALLFPGQVSKNSCTRSSQVTLPARLP